MTDNTLEKIWFPACFAAFTIPWLSLTLTVGPEWGAPASVLCFVLTLTALVREAKKRLAA